MPNIADALRTAPNPGQTQPATVTRLLTGAWIVQLDTGATIRMTRNADRRALSVGDRVMVIVSQHAITAFISGACPTYKVII